MNIRRIAPLALAPILLLAAACGDDDDTATTDAPAAAGTDAPGATTAAGTDAPVATTADGTDAPTDTVAAGATTPADTAAAGTGAPADGGALTVGSADFPESQLLAQIYGQALAAAGFDVDYQLGIGSREIYYGAIESGEIDLVPEYTNSLLSFVLRQDDPNAVPDAANVDEQIAALDEALPDSLAVLTPSTAEDKDTIVCRSEVAEEFDLATLSDLAEVSDQITLGAPPEFEGRSPFGLVGFAEIYGAESFEEFVPLDVGGVADSLSSGAIDCGNLFSTMSVITTEGFVSLEDDRGTVPNEAVLPLVRADVVTDQLSTALDTVNAELTTDVLKELMVRIEADAAAPDVVATEWLDSLG